MLLKTRDKRAAAAPLTWASRYANKKGEEMRVILEDLNKLPASELTADLVNKIIGNDTWTRIECDCCDSIVEAAICATALSDKTSLTICPSCLSDANTIMSAYTASGGD